MTEATHTPGPWKVFYTTNGQTIIGIGEAAGAEGITDPQFGLWRDGAEREANARLIAAAPDLLAALNGAMTIIDLLPVPDDVGDEVRTSLAKRRASILAAIARATGGQHGQ